MEVRVAPGGLIKGPMSLSEFSTMSRNAETRLLSLRTLLDKRLSITDSNFWGEAAAETESDPDPPSGCKPTQVSLEGLDTCLNNVLELKVVSNCWPFLKLVFHFFLCRNTWSMYSPSRSVGFSLPVSFKQISFMICTKSCPMWNVYENSFGSMKQEEWIQRCFPFMMERDGNVLGVSLPLFDCS